MFLDKDCLQDGQTWLGGLVTGLVTSMIFVPLLSWKEHDQGSVGGLSKLGVGGFDRVSRLPPFCLCPSISGALSLCPTHFQELRDCVFAGDRRRATLHHTHALRFTPQAEMRLSGFPERSCPCAKP